jgi:hypothetical protein
MYLVEYKKSSRKYHLTEQRLAALKEEQLKTGKVQNPYTRQGCYRAIVQSLIELGIDKWHSFVIIRNRIREIMVNMHLTDGRTAWDTLINRRSRNVTSGKDLTGKMLQNILILQRVNGEHPYGAKIYDLGYSIHSKKENGILYFMLNTNTNIPSNIGR